MALCGLLLMAAGCKNSKKNEPETFLSNQSAPTWAVTADYDMTSSMTAVVQIDLKAQYPEKASDWQLTDSDLLAAFDDAGNCLGIASPLSLEEGAGESSLFYLYISAPADSQAPSTISLRYYSATLSNIFVSEETFPFSNDAQLGKVSAPYIPTFIIEKQ